MGLTQGQAQVEQAQADSAPQFIAIPGQREFTGRMIARPLQANALEAKGLSAVGIAQSQATARLEMTHYAVDSYVPQTDEYIFEVPTGSNEVDVASTLMATGSFEYVEPDWLLYPIVCSNDQFLGQSWQHAAMRSCDAWDLETGSPTISIGICDTGIRTTHDDLQLHRLEGYNAVDQQWESQGGDITAVHPHGTQCTGSAAANGNNGIGVTGIGWNLSHRMMRVSNVSTGSASVSVLQLAARTSIEAGDRIASVSYSGADSSSNLTTASYIRSIGGLLFWAAGNDSRNLTFGNRDNDDLMVVGATSENETRASFSAYGQFVDFMAPGDAVATTSSTSNSSYVFATGTSFACPIAAGLAGLIWSADPSLTPDQVESIMKQGATDLGSAGVDNNYGYGRIDSLGSLNLINSGSATPPVANFTGAPTSGVAPLTVTFDDLSQNGPTTWNWSFGDGNSSTSQNPSYTYTSVGTYTVSLTVSNADGSDSHTLTNYVTVSAPSAGDVFADGFESGSFGTNGWTAAGNANVSTQADFTGNFGARLRRTGSIEVAVSTAGRTGVALSYARRTRRLDNGEVLTVEWFNGSTWQTVETYNGDWGTQSFTLGSGADNNPNLRIRFTLNANRNNEHAYIDDVVVSAN